MFTCDFCYRQATCIVPTKQFSRVIGKQIVTGFFSCDVCKDATLKRVNRE